MKTSPIIGVLPLVFTFAIDEVQEMRELLDSMHSKGVVYTTHCKWWTFWKTDFHVTGPAGAINELRELIDDAQEKLMQQRAW